MEDSDIGAGIWVFGPVFKEERERKDAAIEGLQSDHLSCLCTRLMYSCRSPSNSVKNEQQDMTKNVIDNGPSPKPSIKNDSDLLKRESST